MKLYEVNQEIENLLEALEPDPETGEVPANEDEIIAQINTLAMKREDILSYLAKLALDVKASVQAMKAEEKRLHDRRQTMEHAEVMYGVTMSEPGLSQIVSVKVDQWE